MIKIAIYLSQASIKYFQVIEEAFSSQKRPSNTSKHELLQTIVYFCASFLPSWIRIPNTDPDLDPQTQLNTDPIRIRIHNPAYGCHVGGDRGQIHAQALPGLSLSPGGQLIEGTGSRVEIDGVSYGRLVGGDRGQIHAQALPGLSLPPGGGSL